MVGAGGLTSGQCRQVTHYGEISAKWLLAGNRIVHVVIPPSTTAGVLIPARSEAEVQESGRPVRRVAGVKAVAIQTGILHISIGSGHYRFQSELPETVGPPAALQ